MRERFFKEVEAKSENEYKIIKRHFSGSPDEYPEEFQIIKQTFEKEGILPLAYKIKGHGYNIEHFYIEKTKDHKAVECFFVNFTYDDKPELTDIKIVKIPESHRDYVEDLVRISIFLQNENFVLHQLKKLDALLKEEAEKRHFSFDVSKPFDYLKHKKLLRDVIERELEKLGFQPLLGKGINFIETPAFLSMLTKGLLIKDPGAGVNHGEFTHAIQWLLIGWQNIDTIFLRIPLIQLFKQLGNIQYSTFTDTTNAWDYLVDQILAKDSRSPEYLNKLMSNNNDPNLSVLKILCHSRMKKRELNHFFTLKKNFLASGRYVVSPEDKNLLLPAALKL